MNIAIVIPCLNEAESLLATAQSLGFGAGDAVKPAARLYLVDNGSKDATPAVMQLIQNQSAPGAVQIVQESERNYVAPRHRGILEAQITSEHEGVAPENVLIVQADADTVYQPGYVTAMHAAAVAAVGADTLIEGETRSPPWFLSTYPGYQRRADEIDERISNLWVDDDVDVIVDDKVAAFRLSQYFAWGGHQREFASDGSEIHAETSRLFIRARLAGANKCRATGAIAEPSRRKIVQNPVRHFASAGFPRSDAWWTRWREDAVDLPTLDAFDDPSSAPALQSAVETRVAHLVMLLAVLPTAIELSRTPSAKSTGLPQHMDRLVQDLRPFVPKQLTESVAPLFERAFWWIDSNTATVVGSALGLIPKDPT